MQNYNVQTRKLRRKTAFKGARVLVVEDRRIKQTLIMKILDDLGCIGDSAFNAAEGIEKIMQKSYDLVFMDCHMPGVDGFEATRQIRQAESNPQRSTTIVALTPDTPQDERKKCIEAGMNDYLGMPFRIEQIADMLNKWVVAESKKD